MFIQPKRTYYRYDIMFSHFLAKLIIAKYSKRDGLLWLIPAP